MSYSDLVKEDGVTTVFRLHTRGVPTDVDVERMVELLENYVEEQCLEITFPTQTKRKQE